VRRKAVHVRAGDRLRVGAGAFECPLDPRLQRSPRDPSRPTNRVGGADIVDICSQEFFGAQASEQSGED
jgi:hypothetical protein